MHCITQHGGYGRKQARRLDIVVLKHTGGIELGQKPVLQVFDQDSALCQKSFVDAEIPGPYDFEEIFAYDSLAQVQENHTCPVTLACHNG